MKIQLVHKFEEIISIENLLAAWQEFVRGKRNKPDIQQFSVNLIDNILQLHIDLANKMYRHGGYYQFNISDPKPRNISKASARDRLFHHAVYRILYPFFDRIFIDTSYSCRDQKGTHKAIDKLKRMFYTVSRNNIRTCWVLKLDIKKFFASIDHEVLKGILAEYIPDKNILWLLGNIIDSFGITIPEPADLDPGSPPPRLNSQEAVSGMDRARVSGILNKSSRKVGLPLGNLTSQLFVNVYMNEFDQFVKHKLEQRHYIRYADDFVILHHNREILTSILCCIEVFLKDELKLTLHPNKIILKTFASGVDFLGWVNFPAHRVLRTATKRRMMKRLQQNAKNETLQSYLGLLKHGNTFKLQQKLL